MKHIVTKEDLKTFLTENKILIKYTRDARGFKNGVVVAIDKNKIGYSKVHEDDYELKTSIKSMPYLQQFVHQFTESDPPQYLIPILQKAMKAINHEDNGTYYCAPKFDRFTALKLAINRAISGTTLDGAPYSIMEDLDNIYVRAVLYFK